MTSVKSYKSLYLIIAFPILFLSTTVSSFSQTKQSYRNHEEIDVGGGMKVEVLKCTGEGPIEECDCIYFTDKRQNGMRMKVNANRLKEEERAAALAKSINKPETNKNRASAIANANNNRADKTIPESIKPRPNAPAAKPTVSLEDAAKRADSVAQASSQKLQESLAKTTPIDDSSEMDKVYIPKVTETGGAELEVSTPKTTTTDTIASANQNNAVKETPKDVAANPASAAANNISNNITAIPVTPKDTAATANAVVQQNNSANAATKPDATQTNTALAAPSSIARDTIISSNTTPKALAAKKDTLVNVTSVETNKSSSNTTTKDLAIAKDTSSTVSATIISTQAEPADSMAENGWVKQYNGVKPATADTAQQSVKPLQNEGSRTDSIATANNGEGLKNTLKNAPETTGSGVMDSPVLNGKSLKKKKEKTKKQPAKTSTVAINQNHPSPAKNTLPTIESTAIADNNPAIAVNNGNTFHTPDSKVTLKDTGTAYELPGNKETTSTSPVAANTKNDVVEKIDTIANNTNVAAEKTGANTSASAAHVVGKTAEVNTKGVWEKVTIIDKETEFLYKVHYKGTSADHDEWVAVTQIRNIDSTLNAVNKPNTDKPAKVQKSTVNCNFEAPAPAVRNSDKFSEKLAKRKIYDNYIAEKKDNSQAKRGVTFLSIKADEPYVNTVTISATNNLEVKLSLAPSGAMIYPVEAQFKLCEQVRGNTSSKTMNANYACFRNKLGSWTCAKVD